jgi:hypothetical protein
VSRDKAGSPVSAADIAMKALDFAIAVAMRQSNIDSEMRFRGRRAADSASIRTGCCSFS